MSQEKVLVVDDEPDLRELLAMTLARMNIACDTAVDLAEGMRHVSTNEYFLVLTDMRLPDGEGLDLVKYIQRTKPQTPVAVITAYGSVEGAVSALKAGAFDYVSKPIDLPMLKNLIKTALKIYQTESASPHEESLIGHSQAMVLLRNQIQKLARSQAPVFIYGASGSGKELVAQTIHAEGPRSDKPFIPVNCGAIPSELMESEFFGHKKGSFTGAVSDKAGLFVAAQGGTLFLDEIAELPLVMQVKLLRAIQEKAVKPIGGHQEIPVDVRILSASNKNLQEEIAQGRFREELYYRINVIELNVPSLKERLEDIPVLARHILQKLAKSQSRAPAILLPESLHALERYHFPGNVRELENILERAVALCDENTIQLKDLNLSLPLANRATEALVSPSASMNLDHFLMQQEKEKIIEVLEKTKWNRTAAAKLLGVSFRTLRYRLKKLGIE